MISMQILRLLFAICTAPIKHLVYLPIFENFVIFPISCEMTVIPRWKLKQRVCNFLLGGGGSKIKLIRFILGDVQIDKLNFQNIYFFIFRGVTTLKFTYNIENLLINSRSRRAFYWHLLIFFTWKCSWFLILNYLLFCSTLYYKI